VTKVSFKRYDAHSCSIYVLNVSYVWRKNMRILTFLYVNEFYVVSRNFYILLINLPAEKYRYINSDIYVEP